ncbi:invasion associated locus B family protein [Sedimenticola selenatireducens]|uniref:invasion associated locus B family protein n=1 Tax=Sedimenticola selenatireducens TaxID=191960 RepID=UPI0004B296CE|nr:invasion associated locus B family protein [Sedimenticola selenatireducens]
MMQRGCAILFLAMAALLAPVSGSLAEQQKGEEEAAEAAAGEVFNDWGRRCETLKTGEEFCLVFQRLRLKENNQTVLHVSFGYPPFAKGPVMVLTTPLGVSLVAGVELKVDNVGEPIKVPYNLCVADGCRASLPVDDTLLEAMKRGDKLKVAIANAQNKLMGIEVSLNGFAGASESLQK